ncbi:MAG: HAD family hydrolase [Clostridia bacterium]|nr:HAD family hydrolase [Clostridiales bacterium]
MIDTVLFDLDGTLLPMDMEDFLHSYFDAVAKSFHRISEPSTLLRNIMKATEYMVRNTEKTKTNQRAFEEEFKRLMGCDIAPLMDRFEVFYTTDFKRIRDTVKPQPLCAKVVETVRDKGYQTVLATNPLFPRIAIEERIRWAGIDVDSFCLITTFEEMHYCKPQIEYYREIMEIIGKGPENCLMVGNDVEEDMVARKLGMKTFLVDVHLIHRTKTLPPVDYMGGYEDLYNFVLGELPDLRERAV